jgi:hypothetical protein
MVGWVEEQNPTKRHPIPTQPTFVAHIQLNGFGFIMGLNHEIF